MFEITEYKGEMLFIGLFFYWHVVKCTDGQLSHFCFALNVESCDLYSFVRKRKRGCHDNVTAKGPK